MSLITPYITPETRIYLLWNVPLDSSYTDTLTFSSEATQAQYFLSHTKDAHGRQYSFTDCTPVRMQNRIRLPIAADNIYDCNYLMFNNKRYETKWYYCFIDEILFINENMCEIAFSLDVMQTWWPHLHFYDSFVVREHVSDDTPGRHTVPEGLELGPYKYAGASATGYLEDLCIAMAQAIDEEGTIKPGKLIGGMYSGVEYVVVDNDERGARNLNLILSNLVAKNQSDAVISIFIAPKIFTEQPAEKPKQLKVTKPKAVSTIDGYRPRNKKLLTYPYNFLHVWGGNGCSGDYRYELFSTESCTFNMIGDLTCSPTVVIYPQDYKGVAMNHMEKLVIDGYPQCTWNVDTYRAWLAKNGNQAIISGISHVLGGIGSVGQIAAGGMAVAGGGGFGLAAGMPQIGSGVSGVLNSAEQIARDIAQVYEVSTRPGTVNGSQGSAPIVMSKVMEFFFAQGSITKEYAQIIDGYFDMYGYKVNQVKRPNLTTRRSWNYVQLRAPKIDGSIPFGDLSKIKQIFSTGITLWHGPNVTIGDYSQPNGVV